MAGFAIRSRFAGHPSCSAKTRNALRLKPDHPIGAGQSFIYNGDLHPEARGEYSAFSEFLKTIGRYEDRQLLHARKKAHWPIDRMLSEPAGTGSEPGYIYRITDIRTGLCYVGLSVNRPEVRFNQHWYKAQNGAETRLHAAMRGAGKSDFKLETFEVVTGNEARLAEREIHWIRYVIASIRMA